MWKCLFIIFIVLGWYYKDGNSIRSDRFLKFTDDFGKSSWSWYFIDESHKGVSKEFQFFYAFLKSIIFKTSFQSLERNLIC